VALACTGNHIDIEAPEGAAGYCNYSDTPPGSPTSQLESLSIDKEPKQDTNQVPTQDSKLDNRQQNQQTRKKK